MSRYYKRAQNIGWFVIEVDTSITSGFLNTGAGNFELRVFGTANNFNIVWGDGTMSRNVIGNITHNYPSAGIYKVAVVGVLPRVFYNNGGDRLKVKKILSFGDIVWGSFQDSFWGCGITDINGIIVNSQAVNSFFRAFLNNQIVNIPAGFFDNCPNTGDCRTVFAVNQITTIPAGLFDNCPLVNTFSFCFSTNQITTISQGLFDNNPLVTNFTSTFQTNGLIPNCPSDLFANNPLVTTFANCFNGSTLPTQTYSDMLVSLDQNNQNLNVPFHGGNSTYTGAAAIAARANLVNVKGWIITDGGQV
jgi:hypothetical protein